MTERRFYRFIGEFDFEITDPVAVRAASMDWTQNEDGSIGMLEGEPIEQVAARVFTMVMDREALERAGLKWLGGRLFPRFTSEDGSTYPPMSLPEMPARRDDGTYSDAD